MSQDTQQTLSALMDGEGDELELRRVLKQLPEDADAADTWRRYHLARSMMQREQGVDTGVDLSAGVMARLADEPAPVADDDAPVAAASSPAPKVSLMRGAGVAAAVSLMVITGVQYFGSAENTRQTPSQASNQAPSQTPEVASGLNTDVDTRLAQTASFGAATDATDGQVPMFEPTPFRLRGEASHSGLMTVSDAGASTFSGQQDVSQQAAPVDEGQVRLLRSYLQQHAHGAAYSNSDSWLPLTRSSAISDALGR